MFDGNTDQDTVVYHDLNPPITARYIRFLPVDWYLAISMRVELYGCTGTAVILLYFRKLLYNHLSVYVVYIILVSNCQQKSNAHLTIVLLIM